jgi:hypothetical protein
MSSIIILAQQKAPLITPGSDGEKFLIYLLAGLFIAALVFGAMRGGRVVYNNMQREGEGFGGVFVVLLVLAIAGYIFGGK